MIGRDDEIRRTIQLLQRRTKNNPVLIGEPGVGKTATAQLVNGEVPEGLKDSAFRRWTWGLFGRCQVRGDFEERLKAVLKALAKKRGASSCLSMSSAPWSGRARPRARWMRATCSSLPWPAVRALCRHHHERIPPVCGKRRRPGARFQKVLVDEPNEEDTIAILRGLSAMRCITASY